MNVHARTTRATWMRERVKRRGRGGGGQGDVRGPTRGSGGSSGLHNLCRYILYVYRYIANYI